MPDFTYEIFFHCASAENFEIEIEGSKGKKYKVRYGWNNWKPHQYDYTCTCESFKFGKGKHCKHIGCKWVQFTEGGEPIKKDDQFKCPKCGNDAIPQRCR
jgi:hypothetical protein